MRKRVSGIVLIAALALAGCAAETPPGTSTPPANSARPDASATALPPASEVAVPTACEELLPIAVLDETVGESWQDAADVADPAETLLGPTARAAAADATGTLSCAWRPESDSGESVTAFAMGIERSARTELVAAFDASSAYEPILLEGADITFATTDSSEPTVYAFIGEVWLAFESSLRRDVLMRLAGASVETVTQD